MKLVDAKAAQQSNCNVTTIKPLTYSLFYFYENVPLWSKRNARKDRYSSSSLCDKLYVGNETPHYNF